MGGGTQKREGGSPPSPSATSSKLTGGVPVSTLPHHRRGRRRPRIPDLVEQDYVTQRHRLFGTLVERKGDGNLNTPPGHTRHSREWPTGPGSTQRNVTEEVTLTVQTKEKRWGGAGGGGSSDPPDVVRVKTGRTNPQDRLGRTSSVGRKNPQGRTPPLPLVVPEFIRGLRRRTAGLRDVDSDTPSGNRDQGPVEESQPTGVIVCV